MNKKLQRDLKRNEKQRPSHDRILIVCEGSKTEPQYFKDIRTLHRLRTTHIEIQPSQLGTTPLQVVNYAIELFQNGDPHKRIERHSFDKIFAVFDRDDHLTYSDALSLVQEKNMKLKNEFKQPVEFCAIASVPSFELWLLLHFQDIHQPIHRTEAFERLKKKMPKYEKGAEGTFAATKIHIDKAKQRAEFLAGKTTAFDGKEPYTNVYELVDTLYTLTK